MHKWLLVIGSTLAGLAVILGAFGAHYLKTKVGAEQVQTFETGVRYQVYHALALMIVGLLLERFPTYLFLSSGLCFLLGIILFSGSLYLLALNPDSFSFLGPVTPLGGLSFITGWILLLISVIQNVKF